jgi:Tfp pilus assembly protein PilN
MKPVNLLPESQRPKRASGARGGSAYMVIGALAILLVAVVGYVLTANGIASKKDEAAKLSRQADAAEARAKTLTAFAGFEQVKQTREQSVRQLAAGRFDWERMLRELARLLPPGTYVTSLEADAANGNASGSGSTGGSTSSASSSSAGGGAGATGPTLAISGCTRSQPEVATVLVRLRRLNRTTDVTLSRSSKNEASTAGGAGATGGAAPAGGAGAQGGSGAGCGKGVSFDATVQFNPTPVPGPEGPGEKVPASLGGGS